MKNIFLVISQLVRVSIVGFTIFLANGNGYLISAEPLKQTILNDHDWEKYPYVGRFNDKGYFYTVNVDANGEFRTKVIGKFHSLKFDAEGNLLHSIVTGKDGKLHPAMGQPRFTMPPENLSIVGRDDPLVGNYDENNVFYGITFFEHPNGETKYYNFIVGKFHAFIFSEEGKIIGSTVIDELGKPHSVTGRPTTMIRKTPASDVISFPETAVAPISPEKSNINYIYGRFDKDDIFYQLKADANGRSRPEMLGKLDSVKLYDNETNVPEYYLVIDKSGNLHSVKETRRSNTARGKAQERMWDVFFRTQDELKKQAKKAEASNKNKNMVKYIFWISIIIFFAGYYFRKDVLKVYRRIKEHLVKD